MPGHWNFSIKSKRKVNKPQGAVKHKLHVNNKIFFELCSMIPNFKMRPMFINMTSIYSWHKYIRISNIIKIEFNIEKK